MVILSTLLALCVGNPPVTGGFPTHRQVKWSFDVNKLLNKQSSCQWFETPWHSYVIWLTSLYHSHSVFTFDFLEEGYVAVPMSWRLLNLRHIFCSTCLLQKTCVYFINKIVVISFQYTYSSQSKFHICLSLNTLCRLIFVTCVFVLENISMYRCEECFVI